MMYTYYLLYFAVIGFIVSDALCKSIHRLEPHLSQSKILNLSKARIHPNTENDHDSEDTNQQPSDDETNEVNDNDQDNVEENENHENETENRKENAESPDNFDDINAPDENSPSHSSSPTESVDINQHTKNDDDKITEDINKDEQIRDMHKNAGDMIKSAEETKAMADDIKNNYKDTTSNDTEETPHTHTESHSIPKVPGEGNIVITNNTATVPKSKDAEEKVDPMKSIINATRSLYERGRQKNLPISEPDDLSTPEQVYAALNALEYIIDGYRHSKIDIKSENSKDDTENTVGEEKSSEDLLDDDDETEALRFLQSKNREDEDGEEDENYENEEDAEDDEDADADENKNNNKLNPHKAAEQIKGTLSELLGTLNEIIKLDTKVSNVLARDDIKKTL